MTYLIPGSNMPTLAQAIQIAAYEGLVRLRYSEPAMAKSRAFHFLPARPQPGAEAIQTSIEGEADPAVITLVTYAAAMTRFSNSLIEELATTRRSLGHAHLQQCRARNPPTLNHGQARGTGAPVPDDLLECSLGVSVAQVLARIRQQPQEPGVVLEGRPVISHPPEDAEVDTTLRLGTAPPTPRGRQAE